MFIIIKDIEHMLSTRQQMDREPKVGSQRFHFLTLCVCVCARTRTDHDDGDGEGDRRVVVCKPDKDRFENKAPAITCL